jgi:2-polyprenyl-3-methyl-5-hydroxy-6-metoxy-1,4-benzoquinol methylase
LSLALLILSVTTVGLARPANVLEGASQPPFTPSLRLSQLIALTKYLSSPEGARDTYSVIVEQLYGAAEVPAQSLLAFEENHFFIYALGGPKGFIVGERPGSESGGAPQVLRRVFILPPSTFVIDDEIVNAPSGFAGQWVICAQNPPQFAGQSGHTTSGDFAISWKTLLPQNVMYQLRGPSNGEAKAGPFNLEIRPPADSKATRFLTLFHVRSSHENSSVESELVHRQNQWNLSVSTGGQAIKLDLPPPSESAGEVAIFDTKGKTLVDSRPLASGVLPHGPEGRRLLELWDADYRGPHPPIWDIGHAADELERVIGSGQIRACRALDLCCGSGNDAIYLARQGFDVTAMDVAPTALSQAQEKAQRAGVSVRWLLADVLAPPKLQPFDFLYDRGCYHVVRDQNLAAYLETLQHVSRPGTQLLLLASKRGDHPEEDGSTGVTEEELDFDFLPLFDLEWRREYRLEANRAGALGPPGWSVLLRRKAQP